MNSSQYIGDELPLFSKAIKWKKYWSSLIKFTEEVENAIEVGAGIGGNIPFLLDKSKNLYLIEPDSGFCKNYLNKSLEKYNSIKIVNGTICDLDKEIFSDLIYYIDVLEHIENDKFELQNAASKLNLNGSIFVLVPAHFFLFTEFDRRVGHFRRYTRKSISKIIPSDYRVVRAKYLDSIGFFLGIFLKILPFKILPTEKNIFFWDRYLVPVSKLLDKLLFYKFGKSLLLEIKRI